MIFDAYLLYCLELEKLMMGLWKVSHLLIYIRFLNNISNQSEWEDNFN